MSDQARDDDRQQMSLAVHFHPTGHHVAAWLHPRSQIDAGSNPGHYLDMAKTAERGKFDLIFLADSLAIREGDLLAKGRWPQYMAYFEPLTLLSAMSSVTSRVGLVATGSTSFTEPFNLARQFASLDHLSGGRAGWNVVTTGNAASSRNFGRDEHFEHDERYERANEFVEVVRGLWDSWDDDAFVMDRASGRYFIPEKMHRLDHKGSFLSVRGPLNMRRPPQGHPVLFQAGTSNVGRETAARIADVVFVQEQSRERCQAISADIKGRMVKYGRSPNELLLMPGVAVVVGRTEAEAKEQHDFLQSKIHPDVGLALIAAELGDRDFGEIDPDKPFPVDRIPPASARTTIRNIKEVIEANKDMTVRQLWQRFSGARGSVQLVGTPERIADELELWFKTKAADGFIIQPSVLPGGLDDFVEWVVPELQRRRLYRCEYQGTMLRDHLGLRRPPNRNSLQPSHAAGHA
jgi:N-acetyl-S-(2-succino)cysteine monooxygenase